MVHLSNAVIVGVSVALAAPTLVITEKPSDIPPALCDSYGLSDAHFERYHGDQVCNRANYNSYKASLGRGLKYQEIKKTTKTIDSVPNAKTVVCPVEVQDLKNQHGGGDVGFDTVWIVENTSSDPIVLSYLKENGVEYSAVNPKITPPQDDPAAIVQPGNFKAIATFEGHVFHARTLDTKSQTLGPVVLQHRTGLIPVGEKFQDLECPLDDPEPLINNERDPKFRRTPPASGRPCNTMDIGFRNMANCPLHGYFLSKFNETSCQEKFKFHLGMNRVPEDFMWGWDSATKFEGTFIGHTFAFRSAANPSIYVDQVTLAPTKVIDCPELKEKVQINKVSTVGELVSVASPIDTKDKEEKELYNHLLVLGVKGEESMVIHNTMNFSNETSAFSNATTTTFEKGGYRPRRRSTLVGYNPTVGIRSF